MKQFAMACFAISIAVVALIIIDTLRSGYGIRAVCGDGAISMSKARKGTCAGHGGVYRWVKG
jgi:hypothetical protein